MPRGIKYPDPASLVAEHAPTGACIYAQLAPVPLYVNVRVLYPRGVDFTERGRRSFYLGYIIEPGRWAGGKDARTLPKDLLSWALPYMRAA